MGSNSEVFKWTEDEKLRIYKLYDVHCDEVEKQVAQIEEWCKVQPHLPNYENMPGDIRIETILCFNKFKTERTKTCVSNYFMLLTMFPEYFKQNPNCPPMTSIEAFYFTPMPRLTPDLKRVFILRMKENQASKFDPSTFLAYIINVYQIRAREECRYQDIHVYDMKNFTLEHVMKFTPTVIRKTAFIFEKMYDGALSSLNFVNVASYVESFVNVVKSVLKSKVQQRVQVHKSVETLYKIVPKENLPTEFGGTGGSLDELKEMWRKKFVEYDSAFVEMYKFNMDLDLLPEKLQMDDYLGVHGNFRKLDVD